MDHNSGIFGNDTDGWTPDCTSCGILSFPNNPMPSEDARNLAKFHQYVMTH